MRVGFLTNHDPSNPSAQSGTPHSTWKALEAAGVDLVDLSGSGSQAVNNTPRQGLMFDTARKMGIGRRLRAGQRLARELILRPWDYPRTIRAAENISARTQALMAEAKGLDVLFGVCMAPVLYRLKSDIPIVYTSDTTATLINASYPHRLRRSRGYHRATEEIEYTALHACTLFAPTSDLTAQSAIDDYGVEPERVRVVELGAHVVPDGMPIDPSPPSPENIELVLVAADPKRKRLGLCIEVTKELRKRGWNATLNFVGSHDPVLDGEETVNWAGRLRLSDPGDRKKHKDILRRSHWMLLPSLAEAFGIAPAEAAHFGRPSVVTDVGGLPTVVRHEKTGMVVSVDAPAAAYADAIIAISSDPARYTEMSQAALQRARTILSWPAWAGRMIGIFEEVAGKRGA